MAALPIYGVNTNLNGVNGFGRIPGNSISTYNALLAITTDAELIVPSSIGAGQLATDSPMVLAIFSYQNGSTVFVADETATNGVTTAAPNATGTFTLNHSTINPTALLVKGGDILHFYALAAAYVAVEFFSIT